MKLSRTEILKLASRGVSIVLDAQGYSRTDLVLIVQSIMPSCTLTLKNISNLTETDLNKICESAKDGNLVIDLAS